MFLIVLSAPKGLFPPEPEQYNGPKLKVAIIGAGLAGMSTAVELLDQGHEVSYLIPTMTFIFLVHVKNISKLRENTPNMWVGASNLINNDLIKANSIVRVSRVKFIHLSREVHVFMYEVYENSIENLYFGGHEASYFTYRIA